MEEEKQLCGFGCRRIWNKEGDKDGFTDCPSAYHKKPKEELDTKVKITGETSDGYHTFDELYEFRKIYNALIFNEWASQDKYFVHKSTKHSDGEDCFGGGWFIVVATLPTGQISNHYELKDWDLFNCEVKEIPNAFDGHTVEDVRDRIISYLEP